MKANKTSTLIYTWEDYSFFLYLPKKVSHDNKPYLYFHYFNQQSGKKEKIRKFIKLNKGNTKSILLEAKQAAQDFVTLLKNNWNPSTRSYNEISLSPLSSILDCMTYYLKSIEKSFNANAICFTRLKNTRILMMHFKSYLEAEQLLLIRASSITSIHIKEMLDSKSAEKSWGKVTYNTYLVDLSTFFNFLLNHNIIPENPARKVIKKNTKHDSTRFKVYEKEELENVASKLAADKRYYGLFVATQLLYKYNIRPIELTRIQVKDIDFDKGLLTLPASKTKNGNEARFLLDEKTQALLADFTDKADSEWFIFGGRNKPCASQVCADYFGQNWRLFKKRHKLPAHLKLYALKHTSNYYDIEGGASYEEIRQRNRHANLQITTLYVKERLFKHVIKPSNQNLF